MAGRPPRRISSSTPTAEQIWPGVWSDEVNGLYPRHQTNQAEEHIVSDRLIQGLEDWCDSFPGYHLYYPSHRQSSLAFVVLVDALRYPEHGTGFCELPR
jgi:hypothetical protein